MRVYLTMAWHGHFGTVTGLEPIIDTPLGTDHKAVYHRPREWLWWRPVCRIGIKYLTGEEPPEPLTPTRYDLTAERID